MKKKTKDNTTKKLTNFKLKFLLMVLLVDAITVILLYFIMPLVQNFPPFSENIAFQSQLEELTHIQQYIIAYILCISVHTLSFFLLMRKIFAYLKKYYNNEKISYNEILQVRKDCINIPYKVFAVQMALIIGIGILFNFIMLVSAFTIMRFTLMIIVIASIISVILLIGTQKMLYKVNISTYEVCKKYEKNIGYRITNSKNLLFQMIPFILVILIVISLIGYSKAVQQEGFAIGNYYRAYLEINKASPDEVSMDYLKNLLDKVPLQSESHYYFIISPNDEEIYTSNPDGSISDFVLKYRDFFYEESNGILYETYGVDEQLYTIDVTDSNGQTWYYGFKYPVVDFDLFLYYFELIIVVLIAYTILLSVWSHNISNNLIKTTERLKDILEDENVDNDNILPIVSNDEFGDLSYYYNKIQELTVRNIEKIHENQNMLMESERLASLGQLIGGIAHNLKTPIMSTSGAIEALSDLIKEYDLSIDDPEVTSKDHHDIAKDMNEWIAKMREYISYMSDIITVVKGQAVTLSETENVNFDIEELLKRVDILMKHELKNALIYLNISVKADEHKLIHGDVNSLVQVINNMISNSIQAYNGKTEQTIDLIVEEKDNNLCISVRDYGCGLPKKVKDKLFKEMITTKGKNGTGLGLYMSYSTIRAHFNGNITFESEEGKGTTFTIILPLQ